MLGSGVASGPSSSLHSVVAFDSGDRLKVCCTNSLSDVDEFILSYAVSDKSINQCIKRSDGPQALITLNLK